MTDAHAGGGSDPESDAKGERCERDGDLMGGRGFGTDAPREHGDQCKEPYFGQVLKSDRQPELEQLGVELARRRWLARRRRLRFLSRSVHDAARGSGADDDGKNRGKGGREPASKRTQGRQPNRGKAYPSQSFVAV